jgi:hypothetical protein
MRQKQKRNATANSQEDRNQHWVKKLKGDKPLVWYVTSRFLALCLGLYFLLLDGLIGG